MNIEILITGDEIRTGAAIDLNSSYIAQVLAENGFSVMRHSCVGDDMDHIVSVLQEIGGRADAGLVTGGLGPTPDDITALAAAKSAGVELVVNQPALHGIERYFKARRRRMTESSKKQAMLPRGAEPIFNPAGTAPGFIFKINRCVFFFMPGVPLEMQRMLSETVIPHMKKLRGVNDEFYITKTISTFGLTESATSERVADISGMFPEITMGFRAKFPEIQIKLYGRGKNKKTLHQSIADTAEAILNKLKDYVFSMNGSPMEAEVGRLLSEKKATLAVAESCTGGLISHMLTNVPGSSNYFLFSGVTYSNEAKQKVLGVPARVIERFGAVHETTAKEMAAGVRRIAGSDYGLATSGIAGPDGGTEEKPVGLVCIGLADRKSAEGFRFFYPFNSRPRNKQIFAVKALDMLRRKLLPESCMKINENY
ncbi:MAG: competence/damage-inducible protein A [Desulfobacterales bacterium]